MKKYIALFLLIVVLATAIGCAEKVAETEETQNQETETPATEEYTPETVDTLTNDFKDLEW